MPFRNAPSSRHSTIATIQPVIPSIFLSPLLGLFKIFFYIFDDALTLRRLGTAPLQDGAQLCRMDVLVILRKQHVADFSMTDAAHFHLAKDLILSWQFASSFQKILTNVRCNGILRSDVPV